MFRSLQGVWEVSEQVRHLLFMTWLRLTVLAQYGDQNRLRANPSRQLDPFVDHAHALGTE